MRQLQAKIVRNDMVAPGFYRMRIASSYLAREAIPGQFVEVRCSEGVNPLLRRPLGVHRITDGGIELLYELVGKGTELLARKKPGEMLDIIGPLGNGFDMTRRTKDEGRRTIIVAGGVGVAPMLALAEEMVSGLAGKRVSGFKIMIGACKKEHILCEKEFRKLGAKVLIATEDGSHGRKGLITDVLKSELSNPLTRLPAHSHTVIYACGPTGMLKAVAEIAHDHRIPCQVLLEERMACGVGVCLGCPVKVVGQEYKMVCKDGPIFNAEEIAW